MLESLFKKPLGLQLYSKETPTQVFCNEGISPILRIKMDVDFEMVAARNGKKFQEMSSLQN